MSQSTSKIMPQPIEQIPAKPQDQNMDYCTEGPLTYFCCRWCCEPFNCLSENSCCGLCGQPRCLTLTCLGPLWVLFCCGYVKNGEAYCCFWKNVR